MPPYHPLGLKAAGTTLGDETLFDEDKWDYVGKYNQEQRACCYYMAVQGGIDGPFRPP